MRIQSLTTIAILCLTVNAFSQIQFTTHIVTPGAGTTDNATYVLTFDVEGDGDMDIVSSSWLDNKIAWYENGGNQDFTQHIIHDGAPGASWLYAIDLDDDEDIDVLSTAMLEDRVYWYENAGQGSFATHIVDSTANPTGWGRFSVSAYDVDSDGDMDVMSGSWYKTEIKWHENDGNQNFTTHLIDNPGQRSHVIAKDLDGDGDVDLLSASQISNTVAWYENDGDENFTTHIISNASGHARTVVATDLDEDGDIDVLAGLFAENTRVEWYENDGNQNFTTHQIPESSSNTGSIYVVDVDNDNDLDIFTSSGHFNMVGWLENDGDENFAFHIITTNAGFPAAVWGSDVDSDGDMDVLSAGLDGDQIAWYESNLNDTPSSVENTATIPLQFSLDQNYPNPFNPTTTIAFSLRQSGFATLKVYNLLGEEVATLLGEHKPAGQHTVNVDASSLASGIYYYTLTAADFKQTRKMLLLR